MTDKPFTQYEMQHLAVLNRIATALEAMAMSTATAPNLQRPLDQYRDFDFSSIGAVVVERDAQGVTLVDHSGFRYIRRSADNKFAKAIWFSRSIGKDPDTGENKYVRLITFKIFGEAEPLPRKVESVIESTPRKKETGPLQQPAGTEHLPEKKTDSASYCKIHLLDMTDKTDQGVYFHPVTGGLCNGTEQLDPEFPNVCRHHLALMVEQSKTGVPFHRITDKSGTTTAYCNGSKVEPNGKH